MGSRRVRRAWTTSPMVVDALAIHELPLEVRAGRALRSAAARRSRLARRRRARRRAKRIELHGLRAGEYCFGGLSFTPHNVVATIDTVGTGSTPGPIALIALSNVLAYCPAGSQVGVITANNMVLGNYGVFILFN